MLEEVTTVNLDLRVEVPIPTLFSPCEPSINKRLLPPFSPEYPINRVWNDVLELLLIFNIGIPADGFSASIKGTLPAVILAISSSGKEK